MSDLSDFTPKLVVGTEDNYSSAATGGAVAPAESELPSEYKIDPEAMQRLSEAAQAGQVKTGGTFAATLHDFDAIDAGEDQEPMRPGLISHRLLGMGDVMFICAEPKVGKTEFVIQLLLSMAAGVEFFGFQPLRPLRTYFLQYELNYDSFRERIRLSGLSPETKKRAKGNMRSTHGLTDRLSEENMDFLIKRLKETWPEPVDILAIDPLNLAGGFKEENSNEEVRDFLFTLKRRFLTEVNPNGAIIIVHHSRKLSANERISRTNAFHSIRGASAMRGFYDTGIIIALEDGEVDPRDCNRVMFVESRHANYTVENGAPPGKLVYTKDHSTGRLHLVSDQSAALTPVPASSKRAEMGRAEKRRAIIEFIRSEAAKGELYTEEALPEVLEDAFKHMGSKIAIRSTLKVLMRQWEIKLSNLAYQIDPRYERLTSGGHLVVYDMVLPCGTILHPTHHKNKGDNNYSEVTDPPGSWTLTK